MTYADQAMFHEDFEIERRDAHNVVSRFASLIARWNVRREQKRRERNANFGLNDDVLRDIGVNRFQIMAAELATSRS